MVMADQKSITKNWKQPATPNNKKLPTWSSTHLFQSYLEYLPPSTISFLENGLPTIQSKKMMTKKKKRMIRWIEIDGETDVDACYYYFNNNFTYTPAPHDIINIQTIFKSYLIWSERIPSLQQNIIIDKILQNNHQFFDFFSGRLHYYYFSFLLFYLSLILKKFG